MKKIARLGVLLALAVGLVAGSVAPASATTEGVLVVQGTARVDNGIAYPCLQGKDPVLPNPPTVHVAKCPVLNPVSNSAQVTFTGQGIGAVVHVNKSKGVLENGTFLIDGSGAVFGYCGLSNGFLSGTIGAAKPVSPKRKTRGYSVNFVGVGGLLAVQGSTSKGENIVGVVVAQPAPGQGTCFNKAPKNFAVAGVLVIHRPIRID